MHQLRSYALVAAFLFALILLIRSFDVDTSAITPFQSFARRGSHSDADSTPRIIKASALYGDDNHLYEEALKSHHAHDQRHGYDMRTLRERITNGYTTKPAFMLSMIVHELTKPPEERAEWVVWMSPDVVLLNPEIPLDIFLPPFDFHHLHFLGTRDPEGLNLGVYFLRVTPWSARMLIDALAYPHDWLGDASEKDEVAMEMVLASDRYRNHVQYQPRRWYNTYHTLPSSTAQRESQDGDLCVHFHDLEGDKWSAMASTLDRLTKSPHAFRVPLAKTKYVREVEDYWQRLRLTREILPQATPMLADEEILDKVRRLQYAAMYEADDGGTLRDALERLSKALGIDVKVP